MVGLEQQQLEQKQLEQQQLEQQQLEQQHQLEQQLRGARRRKRAAASSLDLPLSRLVVRLDLAEVALRCCLPPCRDERDRGERRADHAVRNLVVADEPAVARRCSRWAFRPSNSTAVAGGV